MITRASNQRARNQRICGIFSIISSMACIVFFLAFAYAHDYHAEPLIQFVTLAGTVLSLITAGIFIILGFDQ